MDLILLPLINKGLTACIGNNGCKIIDSYINTHVSTIIFLFTFVQRNIND